jgi:hypothetical protein
VHVDHGCHGGFLPRRTDSLVPRRLAATYGIKGLLGNK